jgi:Uma2 family endonuclease
MSREARTYVTAEEYLAYERRAEYKNEYFDGEVFAMTGASRRHNLISLNIGAELREQLRGQVCETYVTDMRVRIPAANIYTYPDVVAVCGEPKFEDAELDTLINPVLLVEVLSKSTEAYDRLIKFEYYRTLESLTEYLLVSQDEAHITQHVKQDDARWLLTDIRGLSSRVELASVPCILALNEIYDRVSFD